MAWILSEHGFYSIVRKPWDEPRGTLTIRSRVKSDLENLRNGYLPTMGAIIESDDSDYRFRAVAEQRDCANATSKLVADIDYDNFKTRVSEAQGYPKASIYSRVWQELLRL